MSKIVILGQSINEQEGYVHIHFRLTVDSPLGEISQETSVKTYETDALGPAWTSEDIETYVQSLYPGVTVTTVTRLPKPVEETPNADA